MPALPRPHTASSAPAPLLTPTRRKRRVTGPVSSTLPGRYRRRQSSQFSPSLGYTIQFQFTLHSTCLRVGSISLCYYLLHSHSYLHTDVACSTQRLPVLSQRMPPPPPRKSRPHDSRDVVADKTAFSDVALTLDGAYSSREGDVPKLLVQDEFYDDAPKPSSQAPRLPSL